MAGRRNGQDSESFCCDREPLVGQLLLLLPEPAVVRGLPFWGPAGHGNSTFEGTTRECMYGCPTRKQKRRMRQTEAIYMGLCALGCAACGQPTDVCARGFPQTVDVQFEGARFCCRAVRRGNSGTTLTLWGLLSSWAALYRGGDAHHV